MDKRSHEASAENPSRIQILVRQAIPSDLSIVSYRHMEFYGREYGFDLSLQTYLFEGMTHLPKSNKRELGQIRVVERDGQTCSSVATGYSEEEATKLRHNSSEARVRGDGNFR